MSKDDKEGIAGIVVLGFVLAAGCTIIYNANNNANNDSKEYEARMKQVPKFTAGEQVSIIKNGFYFGCRGIISSHYQGYYSLTNVTCKKAKIATLTGVDEQSLKKEEK